ncbi:hypothetical protein SAVIM338S_05380 [Streptomyces avidinii]
MSIKGIRRRMRRTPTVSAAGAASPVSTAGASSPVPSGRAGDGSERPGGVVERGSVPGTVGMAAPSFMILSVRPRREET